MRYVIYNKETTIIFKGAATERAAKSLLTKAVNSGKIADRSEYAITDVVNFDTIEKQVERINLMSGKPYTESVNTPACCSPSTETYWSM